MFDDAIRELEKLSRGISIPVEVAIDEAGYFDRYCPSPTCGNVFKVLLEDWTTKVSNDAAFCPFCRHEAAPTEFNTSKQVAYFVAKAEATLAQRLQRAFQSDAETFNRRQTPGFVTIQLQVDTPPVCVPVPPDAEEAMTLRITCEACDCRYAVVGVGYFCPACGHNSADTTFDQSVERARNVIAVVPAIKGMATDKDAIVQVEQTVVEGTFGNLVTAFQYFAAVVYPKLPRATSAPPPRRNAFQSLSAGSRLWHAAGGREYKDMLDAREMADLIRLFQQRHLLQHTQGIVDQNYLDRSGDTTYSVGQRLVMREQAVLQLADLLTKLVDEMRKDIP